MKTKHLFDCFDSLSGSLC